MSLIWAESSPNHVVLVQGADRLTYRELAKRIASLEVCLRLRGIGKGDCLAVALPNSPEFVLAFLAAARLGCVFLPMNPDATNHEILSAFHECHGRLLLARQSRSSRAAELDLPTLDPADVNNEALESTAEPPDEDTAFIIQYSSGATGRPKRISRSQRNLVAEAENFAASARVTAADKILCSVPLFHAHGLGNCLLASMRAGATLVLQGSSACRSEDLLDLIEHEGITIFPAVPYIFDALAACPARTSPASLSSLRLCFSAGIALPKTTFDRFFKRFGICIRQLYGCTEAGSVSLNLDSDAAGTWDSVGRPLGTNEVAIVDGEVVLRSPALTRGYVDLPDVNRGVFRDGWFFTGDLGTTDAAGRLHIKGRKRPIIDVGGYKVDPREVEAVLMEHSAVAEAAVVGADSRFGSEIVLAVIVLGRACHSDDIAAYCRERLAEFKCPSRIEVVGSLPRSPLGKVLYGKLAGPPIRTGTNRSLIAMERFLRGAVAGIVRLTPSQIDSSRPLMEFGLTSAHAVELAARIKSRTGIAVPATLVWNYPTVIAIARHLAAKEAEGVPAPDEEVQGLAEEDVRRLAHYIADNEKS